MTSFFAFENRAVYEIMWKNVEPGRPQMTIWSMRSVRLIPQATNTHSECVTFTAFPTQLHCVIHINPLNAELNPVCHLLALLGAHHISTLAG